MRGRLSFDAVAAILASAVLVALIVVAMLYGQPPAAHP